MAHEIQDDRLIIYPKFLLKPVKRHASIKDVRKLLFAALKMGKPTPYAETPDFLGVQPIQKVIYLDVPIFDPHAMNLPVESYWVSRENTPEIYEKIMSSPLEKYLDKNDTVTSFMSIVGFDQYKKVNDRFMDLLEVPLSKAEINKKRQVEEMERSELSIPPEKLIATLEELKMEDFPIHSTLESNSVLEYGWVETLPGNREGVRRLVALDCEMCKTVNGYAITRVALIDRNHKILVNEFVKPSEEITDYVTHISGVSENSLEGITTSLSDIQQKLLRLIDGDVILVGHGLVNDLKCLKMKHPYIIDTSLIYHHTNGPPYRPALRDLATRYLKRTIQTKTENGHDPCEDAIASLELLERKLRFGINYGCAGLLRAETLLTHLQRQEKKAAVVTCNAPISVAMEHMLVENLGKNYFPENTDKEACQKIIDLHPSNELLFSRLDLAQPTEEERQAEFSFLFEKIYANAEPQTVFCLATGYRNNSERDALREKRTWYKKNLKKLGLDNIPIEERWTQDEELMLDQVIDKTRCGLVFIIVKNPVSDYSDPLQPNKNDN
ncbi:hypothetical protein BY458DRAFT_491713 [Sporodiniella umbellata]|nr:hypothetical protein BY458DRAFT_491713 [Sporodiniella umbellata]